MNETTLFIRHEQPENYRRYMGARPAKLLRSTYAGKTWTQLAALDSGPVRPEIMLMSTLHGGQPSGVIYHMFGNMARTLKLHTSANSTR